MTQPPQNPDAQSSGDQSIATNLTILSNQPIDDWRGSATFFNGFNNTRPNREVREESWEIIKNEVCPGQPNSIVDKSKGRYFVPSLLKEAPLVGKTLEIAEKQGAATTGKMRSKGHVTEADMLVIDVDGLPEADFFAGLDIIKNDGLTYLAYTTFSHGNPAKPGMRTRIVIPLDCSVNIDEYAAAWHGFDSLYWGGQAGKADPSGANLYQQQGTWCCDSSRKDQALSWVNLGGVASAEALITIGGDTQPSRAIPENAKKQNATNSTSSSTHEYLPSDANKVAEACNQIRSFRDNKGVDQSESLWRDCLGVVGYCQNGAELCQIWSSGHAEYKEIDTAKKSVYRMKFPPTTCNQFRKTNPKGCSGCVHKCKSPITLGRQPFEAIEATASGLNVVANSQVLPDPVAPTTKQDEEAVISRLAGLKPMEYDRLRKKEAKALGVQVKTLDAKVKAARSKADESGQLPFPDVEPWSDAIVPAQLLDEISNTIQRFIVMDVEQADAAALWIALTWFIDEVEVLPLLIINAPEKACGKSQLLD